MIIKLYLTGQVFFEQAYRNGTLIIIRAATYSFIGVKISSSDIMETIMNILIHLN